MEGGNKREKNRERTRREKGERGINKETFKRRKGQEERTNMEKQKYNGREGQLSDMLLSCHFEPLRSFSTSSSL